MLLGDKRHFSPTAGSSSSRTAMHTPTLSYAPSWLSACRTGLVVARAWPGCRNGSGSDWGRVSPRQTSRRFGGRWASLVGRRRHRGSWRGTSGFCFDEGRWEGGTCLSPVQDDRPGRALSDGCRQRRACIPVIDGRRNRADEANAPGASGQIAVIQWHNRNQNSKQVFEQV